MFRSRILVTVLALWGLAMIVPDLVRVMNPLGSFGFYADNDGLIYSISGPFEERAASPAWQAGLRVGDRLDLDRLSCSLSSIQSCSPALTVLGGIEFVLPGKAITLSLAATSRAPAREVTLIAAQRPANFLVRAVNLACQIAGILVVIAAAWLVWTRPSAMSWGFFLYVNWFNPGQEYAFYAILQQWPAAAAFSGHCLVFAEGAAYAGFLLFVLRVPNNETEPRWLPLERTLPAAGLISLDADARLVCEHIRSWQRDLTRPRSPRLCHRLFALGILFARRNTQAPEDYQRVRWVIWGCLIGLPTFLIAELASNDDFRHALGRLHAVRGHYRPALSRERRALPVRVRGATAAAGREREIPLRRVTILGLCLSVPVLLLHQRGRAPAEQSRSAGLGLARARRRRSVLHHKVCTRAPCRPWTATSTAGWTKQSASSERPSNRRRWQPRSIGCWRTRPQRRSLLPPLPRSGSGKALTFATERQRLE